MTKKKPDPKPTPDERKPRKDVPLPPAPAVASDRPITIEATEGYVCSCCGNTKHPPAPCACCGN